ncbi:hypothetical protein KKD19_00200 [Patescibacteria group bacterium]|nr:hypothetical protein [Patescibacteria group bacterium]MBU4511654.1 hypothetical protein [Patescibacteria group bacterium]MCG2693292.1 hypothetical protein [Candidatus Parcubacteria bacterium]
MKRIAQEWYESEQAAKILVEWKGGARQGGKGIAQLAKEFEVPHSRIKRLIQLHKVLGEETTATVQHDRETGRLQAEIRVLKRNYSEAIKLHNLQKAILGVCQDTITAMPAVKVPKLITPKQALFVEEAALMLSDIHGGEEISEEETLIFGRYNWDIMRHRLHHIAERTVFWTQQALPNYRFQKLHLFMLGDMIPGDIHLDTVKASPGNVIEWTLGTACVVAQMIGQLAAVFPKIEIEAVIGNHPRLSKKPVAKERYVNWDYVCYKVISLILANQSNIKWHIPRSFWIIKAIGEKKYLALHGDDIRSWMNIPYYGIDRAVARLTELFASKGDFIHYVLMAHFHNTGILDKVVGQKIINGSVCGPNEFSLGKFMSSEPKQILFGVHPRRGKTWLLDIDLLNAPEPKVPVYKYELMGQGEQLLEVARALA